MKQLTLFPQSPQKHVEESGLIDSSYWKMFIDGASRNNPGPAGIGIYILKNEIVIEQHGFYVGKKTNNQAEYLALVIGIYYLKKHMRTQDLVLILSDSQLLVRQNKGIYKVKHPELKPLYNFANRMLNGVNHDFEHVPREENEQADSLANKGIDAKKNIPTPILDWLHHHELLL